MLRKDLQPGARVFIYARDSGGVASEKSVSDQVRELQTYAQAQGWIVVQCFVSSRAILYQRESPNPYQP
jgi:hypothetical protein